MQIYTTLLNYTKFTKQIQNLTQFNITRNTAFTKLYTTIQTFSSHNFTRLNTTFYNTLQHKNLYTTLHKLYTNFTQLYNIFHKTIHNLTQVHKHLQHFTFKHFTILYETLHIFQKLYKTMYKFTLHNHTKLYTILQTNTNLYKNQENYKNVHNLTNHTHVYKTIQFFLQHLTKLHKLTETIHNSKQFYTILQTTYKSVLQQIISYIHKSTQVCTISEIFTKLYTSFTKQYTSFTIFHNTSTQLLQKKPHNFSSLFTKQSTTHLYQNFAQLYKTFANAHKTSQDYTNILHNITKQTLYKTIQHSTNLYKHTKLDNTLHNCYISLQNFTTLFTHQNTIHVFTQLYKTV